MTDPREMAERIRLDGLVQAEAGALASVWPPAKVLALLRALRQKANESRDNNASGEIVIVVGLNGGKAVRAKLRGEEDVW